MRWIGQAPGLFDEAVFQMRPERQKVPACEGWKKEDSARQKQLERAGLVSGNERPPHVDPCSFNARSWFSWLWGHRSCSAFSPVALYPPSCIPYSLLLCLVLLPSPHTQAPWGHLHISAQFLAHSKCSINVYWMDGWISRPTAGVLRSCPTNRTSSGME